MRLSKTRVMEKPAGALTRRLRVLVLCLRTHRRHIIQQSEYTVCTVQTPGGTVNLARHHEVVGHNNEHQDLLWQINIPVTEKRKVLNYLDRFNLNAFSLFGSEESLMETAAFRELDHVI